jgi:RNA recognition motif-containing protein
LGIKKSTSPTRSSSASQSRSPQPNSKTQSQGLRTEPEALNPDTITTSRLYVGNLSYDTTESDLYDAFTRYGVVKNVEVIMDRRTHRSKGFGFVEMETLSDARQAAVAMHRLEFMGRTIVVSSAKADPASNPVDAAHERSNTYSPSSNQMTTPEKPLASTTSPDSSIETANPQEAPQEPNLSPQEQARLL